MTNPSVRLSASGGVDHSTSVTVTLPSAAAAGELVLFFLVWNETPPFSTPTVSGFTQLGSIRTADWNPMYLFGKIAGGSEPTSYSYSYSGGATDGSAVGYVLVIQNAASSLPSNVVTLHDTVSDTTWTIPGITIATAGSLDIACVTGDGNVPIGGSNYSAWGDSFSALGQVVPPSGSTYAEMNVATATRASSGVRSSTTVTSAVSDKNVSLRVEVQPAGGGAPPNTIFGQPFGQSGQSQMRQLLAT